MKNYRSNDQASLICIFIPIIVLIVSLSMRGEYFRHLTLGDGLSQTTVLAIAQDKLGRMWFGTKEGVNIFDGTSIRVFKGHIYDGDKKIWIGNSVGSIHMDSIGDIYMMIDGEIVKYCLDKESFTKFPNYGKVTSLSGFNGEIGYLKGDSIMMIDNSTGDPHLVFIIPSKIKGKHFSMDSINFYLTTNSGLHIFNRISHKHLHLLPDKKVYSRCLSKDGTLWITTQFDGLYKYHKGDREPVRVSMPLSQNGVVNGMQLRKVLEDRNGRIWFGSFNGLYCYDPATGETRHIEIPQNIGGMTHFSVYGMHCDRMGNIWIGTFYGGVNYFSPTNDKFLNFNYTGFVPKGLSNSLIKDVIVDRNGEIWFATDGAGVGNLDSNWNVKEYLTSFVAGRGLRQNNVRCMAYDSKRHKLYIGTHLGGLSIYDIDNRNMVNLIDDAKTKKLLGDIIHGLKIFNDNLYISSSEGLFYMNLSNGGITKIRARSKPVYFDIDSKGDIYYSSKLGKTLHKVINPLSPEPVNKLMAPDNGETKTTSLCVFGSGVIRATLGHGLEYYKNDKSNVEIIDSENSRLPDNYCYALAKGKGDNLYIASGNNIVQLNIKDRSMKSVPFSGIFPESHIINGSALYSLPDGDILVGSTKGITLLSKDNFETSGNDKHTPHIYFSRLIIHNNDIVPGGDEKILETALPYSRQINLPSGINEFSIIVGMSDYEATTGIPELEYRLDGIDDEWLRTSNNEIKYRNVPPGKYTLYARRPAGEEISITLKVATPWYASWWAWLIYVFIFLMLVAFVAYKTLIEARLRHQLSKEKNEKELIERVNQEKLVFFTDISHEFQTPLTLINSHIDNLLTRYQRHPRLSEGLMRVRSHSLQLSHLVTQLLEFRKLQQNKQVLRLGTHNACESLKEAATPFIDHAKNRDIDYIIDTDDSDKDSLTGVYDPMLLNRVLVNLLSNAFKYTPDGGRIYCTVRKGDSGELIFEVKDSGKGIAEKDLPFIFDRFYNGTAEEINLKNIDAHSTGIGLAFAKSIVERHHGRIEVESKEGVGSKFLVTIPATEECYEKDENIVFDNEEVPQELTPLPYIPKEREVGSEKESEIGDAPLILIVEDNQELVENLKEFFSDYYRVEIASDGKEGLKKAFELTPDIIISDVMMPNMSGIEMCRIIKSDRNLCHIPVILLTALHSTESKLEGLSTHADDYVTKPFESKLLLARVDNLLRLRRVLRKQFEKQSIEEVDMSNLNPLDRDLLRRTTEIIEKNISNLNFDIPTLCKEVAMSRSLFFNKFKSLMGMTPNAYIQKCRLTHAAHLLKDEPYLTIAEVADRCGFETAIYFSRCFKKQYGVPPLQYRKGEV